MRVDMLDVNKTNRDLDTSRRRATQRRVSRNRERGLKFERDMFNRRSRYLVLFLTVGYKERYRHDVSLITMQKHRDRFIRRMRSNPLLQGCLWRLEEGGQGGGLHLHFLIFHSAVCKADILAAKRLGDQWVEDVTWGWGAYWNSNARREHYQWRWGDGLGQVNRMDGSKRESLQAVISDYFAKDTQVPDDRSKDDKLFGVCLFG